MCVENSNPSQMVGRSPACTVEAHSAGSRPSVKVNPRAVQFMAEKGYDLSTHASKGLDSFNGTEIDAAVTMGCGDS